jgi:hypothetical protein
MQEHLSKEEIVDQLRKATRHFSSFCGVISDEVFFRQPKAKWSVAQNVTHLVTSANMTKLAYKLPKFVVKMYGGKPNRESRTFDALIAKYKAKLEQGGKASGVFVAKPVSASRSKEKILQAFEKSMEALSNSIQQKWEDAQLDQFLCPHPLLGKLTLRELGYFTIYHTEHHLNIIKERMKDQS